MVRIPAEVVEEQLAYMAKWRLAKSGLSPVDCENTLERFDPTYGGNHEALQVCLRFAEQFQPRDAVGLLLWGKRGVGKSHLCAGIALKLMERGLGVRKYEVPELLARGRSLFADENPQESELWESLKTVAVVWLDEFTLDTVGSGAYETTRAVELLYRVVNTLVNYKAGLLITTNHELGEFTAGLRKIDPTERIMDRLRGVVFPVHVKGESVRAALRKKRAPAWMEAAEQAVSDAKLARS